MEDTFFRPFNPCKGAIVARIRFYNLRENLIDNLAVEKMALLFEEAKHWTDQLKLLLAVSIEVEIHGLLSLPCSIVRNSLASSKASVGLDVFRLNCTIISNHRKGVSLLVTNASRSAPVIVSCSRTIMRNEDG